jgi:mono/diheme cytochrome c family protein
MERRAPNFAVRGRWVALVATGALAGAAPVASAHSYAAALPGRTATIPGVADPARAWRDWALNCQGCHRADGDGSPRTAPRLAGAVAKYLGVAGGREYLGRIPGIASSPLHDARLAEVVNWMLWRFDGHDLPAHFRPFTAAEIGRLRVRPLRLRAAVVRRELQRRIHLQKRSAVR